MPSINSPIGPLGPLLQVIVGVSQPRQRALLAAGKTVPSGVTGQFLVDTGASLTCVDPGLIKPLNLQPTSAAMIHTPSTNGQAQACFQYDAMLFIPGSNPGQGYIIDAIPIIETELKSQGIDGLLGRDILSRCTLIYNSSLAMFTLAY